MIAMPVHSSSAERTPICAVVSVSTTSVDVGSPQRPCPALEDTLELLSDPEAMRELDESRQAYAAGDFVTGEELRSRYLAK